MDRYQELKKANNEKIIYFGEQYKNLAYEYIKQARKFAVKNVDTEIKIKDTLEYLASLDERRVNINSEIPNQEAFINEKIKLLSKRYVNKDYIKGMVIAIILLVIMVSWIIVSRYFARDVNFRTPENFNGVVSGKQIYLTWDEIPLANSYTIYYVDEEGHRSSSYYAYEPKYTFDLEYNKTYTFYVYVTETSNFLRSETAKITLTTAG